MFLLDVFCFAQSKDGKHYHQKIGIIIILMLPTMSWGLVCSIAAMLNELSFTIWLRINYSYLQFA